jgi:hypothetical protein
MKIMKKFKNGTLRENYERIMGKHNLQEDETGSARSVWTPDNTRTDLVIRFFEDRKSSGWDEPRFRFSGHVKIGGNEVSIESNVIKTLDEWESVFGQQIPNEVIQRLN